jgi:uncharacterized protein (DUF58 family)
VETYQRGVSSLFVTTMILALVGLCLLPALVNGNLHLTVLCLLVFAIMGGLRLWTGWGASHIEFVMDVERGRLFPDESLQVVLTARNRRFLPLSFEVNCPISDALRAGPDAGPLKTENTLLWFQSFHLKWDLQAVRRGVHLVGPTTTAVGDLLGFYMKQKTAKEPFKVIVYPRLVPLRPLPLPKRDFFGVPGGESPVDDPVYILGTVDYRHGRPARHIHWKASARHNRLQQKVFEPTEQEKILLVVDVAGFSGESWDEAFEETLEVVASLAARLDGQASSVGFLTNAVLAGGVPFISATRSPFQIGAILETLACMARQQQASIIDILRANPAIPWGTTCIYFAREATGETDLSIAALHRRRTPIVFLDHASVRDLREKSRDEQSHPGRPVGGRKSAIGR